jgi:DNA invertase Pin-like site-specific DNA recombinase
MEKVGYARVSSIGQSLDIQINKLREFGCQKIFGEKKSGAQAQTRTELLSCIDYVREGDMLVVCKLDRMARSMLDLMRIAEKLKHKGVELLVLDQAIDTRSAEGQLLFHLLGSFAQFENAIRAERQKDGIIKARDKGIRFGRSVALSQDHVTVVKRLRSEENFSIKQLQDKFSVSRTTIYRALSCGVENNSSSAAH